MTDEQAWERLEEWVASELQEPPPNYATILAVALDDVNARLRSIEEAEA